MNEELMNTPVDRWGVAWQRFMGNELPRRNPTAERKRQMGGYPSSD